ncbi:MAG: LPS export ABC transporter periplasmic protein LptC [Pyrinomonadaceae bacterium]
MQEIARKKAAVVGLRARLPWVARVAALSVLVLGISFLFVSYYKRRNNTPFRLVSQSPELSTQVTGDIKGIERRETKNDRLWILLRAGRDVSYADGHHELEDVYLEVYPQNSDRPDRITARKSVVDAGNSRFTFSGDVRFETHDSLHVQTETITYDRAREIAATDEPVNFTRENMTGRARGAIVNAKDKQLELRSEVEITVKPGDGKTTGKPPVPLGGGNTKPVTIRSARATFDQNNYVLLFLGGATAEQEQDRFSAETLKAVLNEQKQLRHIEARQNSYLRTVAEARATEISSADMDFTFDGDQQLERAVAAGAVRAHSVNADSEMQLTAERVNVSYQPQQERRRVLRELNTEGRSVMTLSAPQSHAGDAGAANKRLTADKITLFWRLTGRDLERAEAVGDAELVVEPVQQQSTTAERKTLTAPRIDCDFYEIDNLARLFTASGGEVKAVITPLQPQSARSERTLTANRITAAFVRATQDAERVLAEGGAKFNEQDRHGQADNMTYTAADETIRLRGGEPVVWDASARIKAAEIDADTRQDVSFARERVTTTYYSQQQTGGAAPFAKTKSPVFIASDGAEFRHLAGVAVYTGNARAWQDDNFVRANRLTLRRDAKSMEGEGAVESALYQAQGRDAKGNAASVPVFATAERMTYAEADRLLHYEGNVDIKQGTDRLTSGTADVFLRQSVNEVDRTVAERNVVVQQPGRRGTGDWAQYTAADEVIVLKGEPARVEDTSQGTSESRRLTVYMRESRVVSDDASNTQQSTGRVRTTHRVRKQKE